MWKQILNPIREDGPDDHIVKKIGTPTMGGVLILIGLFSGIILWGDLTNIYIWFLIYIVGSYGLLGAFDDYKKVKYKNSSCISFKFKLTSQIFIAFFGIIALTYLGAEDAQLFLQIPSAVGFIFQGLVLFYLLGAELLINYKLSFKRT